LSRWKKTGTDFDNSHTVYLSKPVNFCRMMGGGDLQFLILPFKTIACMVYNLNADVFNTVRGKM